MKGFSAKERFYYASTAGLQPRIVRAERKSLSPLFITWVISFLLLLPSICLGAPKWDVLSESEQVRLHHILDTLKERMEARQLDGTAPMLTFEELYEGLGKEDIVFMERVMTIDPQKDFDFQGGYLGAPGIPDTILEATGREKFELPEGTEFVRIQGQRMSVKGEMKTVDPQYLPENVFNAYQAMMDLMEIDLGKRLLVESGYRSPAYQLYQFLFFTPKHNYSLVETGHWVAIPGYSEHGAPHRQAIDFISKDGINGEDNPEEFEALPEYEWLLANAGQFGFVLSYPKDKKGITFEPWHWSYSPEGGEE